MLNGIVFVGGASITSGIMGLMWGPLKGCSPLLPTRLVSRKTETGYINKSVFRYVQVQVQK